MKGILKYFMIIVALIVSVTIMLPPPHGNVVSLSESSFLGENIGGTLSQTQIQDIHDVDVFPISSDSGKVASGVRSVQNAVAPSLRSTGSNPNSGAHADCPDHSGWTELPESGGDLGSGKYFLSSDLTLTATLTIAGNADVTLCLNGFMLTGTGYIIRNYVDGATLNLHDCQSASTAPEHQHKYTKDSTGRYVFSDDGSTGSITGGVITGSSAAPKGLYFASANGSTFNMYGGTFSGLNESGAGVEVFNGTFNMYGGAVSGNTAIDKSCAGVNMRGSSSFTMYGGEISNNTSTDREGGVSVGGTSKFIMKGGTISGNSATGEYGGGGGVFVSSDASFEMNDGTISGNTAEQYGGGVYIQSSTASFTMNGGTISGNKTTNTYNNGGGGVYNSGTFNMTDGTISGNTATLNGGGVYNAAHSTFTISGGTISGNEAVRYGGGVFNAVNQNVNTIFGTININGGTIADNTSGFSGGGVYNNGTVNMSGGTISDNTAERYGGGGIMSDKGTFTMTGGTISGNTAEGVSGFGGGVSSQNSIFNMSGGSIFGNTAEKGGGVYNSENSSFISTFTMTGGTISGNTATSTATDGGGGGVYTNSSDATFEMNGGEISGNTATRGGGVMVFNSTFSMGGGTISGNTATSTATNDGGGGVYAHSNCSVKGAVTIWGNYLKTATDTVNNNLFIPSTSSGSISHLIVAGSLSKTNPDSTIVNSKIGITIDSRFVNKRFTTGYGTTGFNNGTAPYNYFVADEVDKYAKMSSTTFNTEVDIDTGGHAHDGVMFGTVLTSGGTLTNGGKYYLSGDLTKNITIAANTTVDLCLNGHKLTGSGTDSVIKIETNGKLSLHDCNGSAGMHSYTVDSSGKFVFGGTTTDKIIGGVVTGGSATDGGGIQNNGTINFTGGTISGNSATKYGGGINNSGTLDIKGGNISGNTAEKGGGVYNVTSVAFTMSRGKISENTAKDGGGVFNGRDFKMSGGEITKNIVTEQFGGGIRNNGFLTLSGLIKISGNKKGTSLSDPAAIDNNVYLQTNNFITISAKLTNTEKIGISLAEGSPAAFTLNYGTHNKDGNSVIIAPDTYFSGDQVEGIIKKVELDQGEATIATYYVVTLNKNTGSGGDDSVEATNNEAMPTIVVPTKALSVFMGYFDAQTGGTQYYNQDGTSAKVFDKLTPMTLYAQWKLDITKVTDFALELAGGGDTVFKGSVFEVRDLSVTSTTAGTNFGFEMTTDKSGLKDMTVDNTNASISGETTGNTTARIKITGKDDYVGVTYLEFSITAKTLTDAMVTVDTADKTYNETPQKVVPTIADAAAAITANDYDITYKRGLTETTDFTSAGTITVLVTAKGNYTGSISNDYVIKKAEIALPTVTTVPTFTYDGTEMTFAASNLTGFDSTKMDLAGTLAGTNAGDYTATVSLKDDIFKNYKWKDSDLQVENIKWTIAVAENTWTTEPTIAGWIFGSTESTPQGAATFGTVAYQWKVSGADDGTLGAFAAGTYPVNAGDYTLKATVAATGNYSVLTKEVAFTIAKKSVTVPSANANLSYTGAEQTGVDAPASGSGYTITGNKKTNAGDYEAVVTVDANHKWDSGDEDIAARTIEWSIAKVKLTVAPKTVTLMKKYDGTADYKTTLVSGTHYTVTGGVASDTPDITTTSSVFNSAEIADANTVTVKYTLNKLTETNYTVDTNEMSFAGNIVDVTDIEGSDYTISAKDNNNTVLNPIEVDGIKYFTKSDATVTVEIGGSKYDKIAATEEDLATSTATSITFNADVKNITFYLGHSLSGLTGTVISDYGIDKAATATSISAAIIDTENPSTSYPIAGWFNDDTVTLTIGAIADTISGIDWSDGKMTLSTERANGGVNEKTVLPITKNETAQTVSAVLDNADLALNGTYLFEYCDKVGHTAQFTIEIEKHDNVAPTISDNSFDNSTWTGKDTITFTISEAMLGSGLDDTVVTVNGIITKLGNRSELVFDKTGEKKIKITVTDNAGNVTVYEKTAYIDTVIDVLADLYNTFDNLPADASNFAAKDIAAIAFKDKWDSLTATQRTHVTYDASASGTNGNQAAFEQNEAIRAYISGRETEINTAEAKMIIDALKAANTEAALKAAFNKYERASQIVKGKVGEDTDAKNVVDNAQAVLDVISILKANPDNYIQLSFWLDTYLPLTPDQVALANKIDEISDTLETRNGHYEAHKAEVDELIDAVNEFVLAIDNKADAQALVGKYGDMTAATDSLTSGITRQNLLPLNVARKIDAMATTLEKVQAVEQLIAAIPEVANDEIAFAEKYLEAKDAFDALTSLEKELVSNADLLIKKDDDFVALPEDTKEAVKVIHEIKKLAYVSPTATNPSDKADELGSTAEDILAVEKMYSDLTDTQKTTVDAYTISGSTTAKAKLDEFTVALNIVYGDDTKLINNIISINLSTATRNELEGIKTRYLAIKNVDANNKKEGQIIRNTVLEKLQQVLKMLEKLTETEDKIDAIPEPGTACTENDCELCNPGSASGGTTHIGDDHILAIENTKILYEKLSAHEKDLLSEERKNKIESEYNRLIETLSKLEQKIIISDKANGLDVSVFGLVTKIDASIIPGIVDAAQIKLFVEAKLSQGIIADLPSTMRKIASFDIKLMGQADDGVITEIQPSASVLVKLPVGTSIDIATAKVYHLKNNGARTLMSGVTFVLDNGQYYALFETDSFSEFVVVDEKKADSPSGEGNSNNAISKEDLFWGKVRVQLINSAGDSNVVVDLLANGYSTVPQNVLEAHKNSDKTLIIKSADGTITITSEMASAVSYTLPYYTIAELQKMFDETPPVVDPTPSPSPENPSVPTVPENLKPFVSVIIAGIVALSLITIIIAVIVRKKKRNKNEDNK